MTLLSRLDHGGTVKSVVISLGNYPGEYESRLQELEDVRAIFGYEIELIDKEPPTSIQSLIRALEKIVIDFAPDEIFYPSPDDRHQDHEFAARASMVAGRKIPNVYLYTTPSTLNFSPNHYFVGTPELLDRKLQLLSLFFTQQKAYNIPTEIRALAQATGRKAMQYASGAYFAEGFASSTISFAEAEPLGTRHVSASNDFDNHFLQRAHSRFLELLDSLIPRDKITAAQYPWELIRLISTLTIAKSSNAEERRSLILEGDIHIESGAILPDIGHIKGPVFIGSRAEIQNFATIIGPSYIGSDARIGPYSIVRESMLAPNVKIGPHAEVTRSCIFDRTILSHKNIVGDSFIGSDCWLGGEVGIANLRVDHKNVRAYLGTRRFVAGMKFGATIEDNTKIPATVKILPGSYIPSAMRIGFGDLVHGIYLVKNPHRVRE